MPDLWSPAAVGACENAEPTPFWIQSTPRTQRQRKRPPRPRQSASKCPPPRSSLALPFTQFRHPLRGGAGLGTETASEAQHRLGAQGRDWGSSRAPLLLQPRQQLPHMRFVQSLHFFDRQFDCARGNSLTQPVMHWQTSRCTAACTRDGPNGLVVRPGSPAGHGAGAVRPGGAVRPAHPANLAPVRHRAHRRLGAPGLAGRHRPHAAHRGIARPVNSAPMTSRLVTRPSIRGPGGHEPMHPAQPAQGPKGHLGMRKETLIRPRGLMMRRRFTDQAGPGKTDRHFWEGTRRRWCPPRVARAAARSGSST